MTLMHKTLAQFVAVTLSLSAVSAMAATNLTGAGGTFPAPVYNKWAAEYNTATGSQVNYQGIGSSGGVKQIIAKTVDFGASDAPMKDADLEKMACSSFRQLLAGWYWRLIFLVSNLDS